MTSDSLIQISMETVTKEMRAELEEKEGTVTRLQQDLARLEVGGVVSQTVA